MVRAAVVTGLHVHNVNQEHSKGNKEERGGRHTLSFPYKIRLEL